MVITNGKKSVDSDLKCDVNSWRRTQMFTLEIIGSVCVNSRHGWPRLDEGSSNMITVNKYVCEGKVFYPTDLCAYIQSGDFDRQ